MDSKKKCCEVTTMCGYSLQEGVVFIGAVTTLTSIITLAYAATCVGASPPAEKGYNGRPMMAVDMIFGLYSMSVSLYQIVISLLLIWQAAWSNGDIFLCTLWHVSHLSILSLYCLLITAKATISYIAKQYFKAIVTAVVGLTYKAVFIYFSVVVNSFSYSLDEDIYY